MKIYPNAKMCQVVMICIGGKSEGFIMKLLEEAEMGGWYLWVDIIIKYIYIIIPPR